MNTRFKDVVFAVIAMGMGSGGILVPAIAADYSDPPSDVAWQYPAGKVVKFKAKLCDKEVTYCMAYLAGANPGEINSMVCRAKADGNCPTDADDCGANDKTISFAKGARGESVLASAPAATQIPVTDHQSENQKKASEVKP